MKKRPSAEDRELADIWRKLKPGEYRMEVRDGVLPQLAYLEPAELKVEGSCRITLGDRKISVVPCNVIR